METFGSTFGSHFQATEKVKRVFSFALLGRGYLGHIREKGETGTSGTYLGDILEPSGIHLGAEGNHLGAIWKHLGAIWDTSGGHLGGLGSQGAPKVV